MNLIIFDGIMGSGKTLGMTLFAKYYQSQSNCALYSNCGIKDSKPFENYTDFLKLSQETSSIVCLDEAHIDLDGRNYNTNSVKFFTHLVFYLRKLRTTLFMTTPLIETLDSRVRLVTNIYCAVRKDNKFFYYNLYDLQSDRFLKKFKIAVPPAKQIASEIYDTYSMVSPIEWPESRNEYLVFMKQLKEINADYQNVLRKSS